MLLDQNLRKGADFVKLALKVMLWKRFGEAWRSLGGVPEEVLGVLGGLLVSGCRFVKKCDVFDPKLGSMFNCWARKMCSLMLKIGKIQC